MAARSRSPTPTRPCARSTCRPAILHSRTLRSNRSIDPSISQQKLTLPADIEALNAKSILERTKVSVTNDAAKVMVLSIYDKKPFWMVTSQHVKLEVRTVKRRRWNAELRTIKLVIFLRATTAA